MANTTNLNLTQPAPGDTGWTHTADLATIDAQFAASGTAHSHNGTAGKGPKLAQANTHESPDTDASTSALHHTLGTGANQAAQGSHTHTGMYVAGGTDVAVADGGTGASTASAARTNLGLGTAATTAATDYAAASHTHAAADIASGTIAPARLGSGTADSTTILYGDSVYRTAPTGGGGGTGDASTNTSTSVDGEGVLFSGTGGKTLKRSTLTGLVKATSGVHAAAVAGTDYSAPGHTHAAADVTSGTIAQARLGTGSGGAGTKFLADDQTYKAVSGTPDPTTTATVMDDFLAGGTTSGALGALGWQVNGGSTSGGGSVAGHPGYVTRSTGTTSGTFAATVLARSTAAPSILLIPADTFDLTWIVRLNTVDTNTTARIGALDSITGQPSNGVYLEKLDADTNWFAVARSASTQTRSDTGVAVSTGWARLRVRRIDASTIGFSINGGSETTLATTVPTATLGPAVVISNSAAAAKTIDLDYFGLTLTGLSR